MVNKTQIMQHVLEMQKISFRPTYSDTSANEDNSFRNHIH